MANSNNVRVENGVELYEMSFDDSPGMIMALHYPPLKNVKKTKISNPYPHYGVMLYRDFMNDVESYWMPKKIFASFNLSLDEDLACIVYFSKEEFIEFIKAIDLTEENTPQPTERGKLVYHHSYGNDTNSQSIVVWHMPTGRDNLARNHPAFSTYGSESEYDEPTVLIMMHNADWSEICYIPMIRVQTIRQHLLATIEQLK